MSVPSPTVAVSLMCIVAVAAFTDLRTRRIPNALSLGGAALGLLINGMSFGLNGVLVALLGWALCVACFAPLYVTGAMGAGDVKLMGAVGALVGPLNGLLACMVTFGAGAALGALCLTWRGYVARFLPHAVEAQTLHKIPYAGAIAIGAVAAVLQPSWVTALFRVTQ